MKKKTHSVKYVEQLRFAYVDEKRSTTNIANNSDELFGFKVSVATVYTDLKRNNIPLRSKSQSVSMVKGALDKCKSFLTENIIEWVDGLMLGDGTINFRKPNYMSARVRIDSTSKKWVEYGTSGLIPYSPREPKVIHKVSKKHPNPIWQSQTLMHPDLVMQARRWYSGPNQTKVIPKDVRITPTSVILWYLGDGSFHYEPDGNMSMLRLATCSFKRENLETIIVPQLQAHEIDCYVDEYKNDIHIRAHSIRHFFNFIGWKSPISCYDYKFDIPDWLKLIRLSDIVRTDKEKWRLQYYYKSGKLECTKSPGGRMLLFTREQAEKARNMLV